MSYLLPIFQNRALRFALLAGALSAAASYFLISYLLGQSYVLVATKKIEEGAVVSRENVALKRVPNSSICPGAVHSFDGVVGRKISAPRFPGDQINQELFSEERVSWLSEAIPRKRVLVSFYLADASLSSGIVREGDIVDVIAVSKLEAGRETKARTVLRKTKLLRVNKNLASSNLPERTGYTVCFAVSLEEAEYLYALEAQDSFRLALESKDY